MALSKRQSARLGALLSVMSNEAIPEPYFSNISGMGLIIAAKDGEYKLSEKGLDEKNRLCTLAGLNIKYLSERSQ